MRWRCLRWRALAVAAPACAVGMISAGLSDSVWLAPVAGVGYLVVADIVEQAVCVRRRDELGLALWLLLALPVALYLNLAAKYVVVSAPAVAIIVGRRASAAVLSATVAIGVIVGVAIIRGDARFAEVGRRAGTELVAPHVARGERVWFTGHWGFQWYAERAGGRALTTTSSPMAGDLLVSCDVAGVSVPAAPPRDWLATVEDPESGGIVMSERDGVGFFSNMWGFLPWWWSRDSPERCDAWRVK
jgi:hypothetical protein